MARMYLVHFTDGSRERLKAEDIAEAREMAKELWEAPVEKVVVEAELEPEPEEEDDEEEEEDEDADEDDEEDEGE